MHQNDSMYMKGLSAFLYSTTSVLIVFTNKIVLTTYGFPSFQTLALTQLVVTSFALKCAHLSRVIKLQDFTFVNLRQIMPLPIFFILNLVTGLASVKSLTIPMLVVLRQFSILFTMFAELHVLKMKKSFIMQFCVYLMIVGAVIAAFNDLSFDLYGYTYTMLNNIFTTASTITIKAKLDRTNFGEYDLLYFNSFFCILPIVLVSSYTGEELKLQSFKYVDDYGFWCYFTLTVLMGILLNYAIMLCTKHNSPLTTSVFGCIKNILVVYGGMFIGGDYKFTIYNFIGITLSVVASIIHSYFTFKQAAESLKSPKYHYNSHHHHRIQDIVDSRELL